MSSAAPQVRHRGHEADTQPDFDGHVCGSAPCQGSAALRNGRATERYSQSDGAKPHKHALEHPSDHRGGTLEGPRVAECGTTDHEAIRDHIPASRDDNVRQ